MSNQFSTSIAQVIDLRRDVSHRKIQDVFGRVFVAVVCGAARALPRANNQRHMALNCTAMATRFARREKAVNGDQLFAVAFAFVIQQASKRTKRSIANRTRKAMVTHHAAHVQILNRYHVKTPHQIGRDFVQMVEPCIGNSRMDSRHFEPRFFAPFAAFGFSRKFALCLRQLLLPFGRVFGISNASPVAQSRQAIDSQVHTNAFTSWRQRFKGFVKAQTHKIASASVFSYRKLKIWIPNVAPSAELFNHCSLSARKRATKMDCKFTVNRVCGNTTLTIGKISKGTKKKGIEKNNPHGSNKIESIENSIRRHITRKLPRNEGLHHGNGHARIALCVEPIAGRELQKSKALRVGNTQPLNTLSSVGFFTVESVGYVGVSHPPLTMLNRLTKEGRTFQPICVPFANHVIAKKALNGHYNCGATLERPRPMDFDFAQTRNRKGLRGRVKLEGTARVFGALLVALALEGRITRALVEKVLETGLQVAQGLLRGNARNFVQPCGFLLLFQQRERRTGLVVTDGITRAIGVGAKPQRPVVNKANAPKHARQMALLLRIRVKPKTVADFAHINKDAFVNCQFPSNRNSQTAFLPQLESWGLRPLSR